MTKFKALSAFSMRAIERRLLIPFRSLQCNRGDEEKVDHGKCPKGDSSGNSRGINSRSVILGVRQWMRPGHGGAQLGKWFQWFQRAKNDKDVNR